MQTHVPTRQRLVFALTALCAVLLVATDPVAADGTDGRVELQATLEPAMLKPGGSGTLKVTATIPLKVHIYATNDEGFEGVEWRVIESEGVTYDLDNVKMTEPHDYMDPAFGDVFKVYEGSIEWTIPVSLAKDAPEGARIGISFDYSGCDDKQCHPRHTNHGVALEYTPKSGGATWAIHDPAPGSDVAAKPKLTPPVTARPGVDEVRIELVDDESAVQVTITPGFGSHIYGTAEETNLPVTVEPVEAEGVEWGTFEVPNVAGWHDPMVIKVPFERTTATSISLKVGWQACADMGACFGPEQEVFTVAWAGPAPKAVPDKPEVPQGEVKFPVIEGDVVNIKSESLILDFYNEHGLLVLGLIFGLGVLLAFTPCVLPIIPITVAVITGGRADIPRRRLLGLLLTYITSLALTFGSVGIITALAGASMSAAFQNPAVIIGISALFGVLAFGMLGIFELQPPQWMLRIQGGAQQKGGSYLGAVLLGSLMALVASPCTGPFIVGMGVVSAKTQSVALGFAMFTSLGLGMGAVMFAFGALNFALRPGPWMVWIRYSFAMLLMGGALYQLGLAGILEPQWIWIIGIAFAVLAGGLVIWHLKAKEGESSRNVLLVRGGGVAAMLVLSTALVAILTKPPAPPPNVDAKLVKFETLRDVDHLMARVEESKAEGKPVVVDVWATWCTYCKKYEELILEDPELRHGFSKFTRLKIDTTDDDQVELRDALGIPRGTQPFFVFFDDQGNIRRGLNIEEWHGDDATAALQERINAVLPKKGDGKKAAAAKTESASK